MLEIFVKKIGNKFGFANSPTFMFCFFPVQWLLMSVQWQSHIVLKQNTTQQNKTNKTEKTEMFFKAISLSSWQNAIKRKNLEKKTNKEKKTKQSEKEQKHLHQQTRQTNNNNKDKQKCLLISKK